MKIKGAIATGHEKTTDVAREVLAQGGNAFDAAIAAFFMSCLCEPVLASLGGGGFMLAKTKHNKPVCLDFFVQTPRSKNNDNCLDIEELEVDFGSALQTFHMGTGSVAVPGCVKGMFEIHRNLATIPMPELVSFGVEAAKKGVEINSEQANVFNLVKPIYTRRNSAKSLFSSVFQSNSKAYDKRYQNIDLADFLEVLAIEGEDLFYQGECAASIDAIAKHSGGSINKEDLHHYRCEWRKPLAHHFKNKHIFMNPPPSAGGMLINFALDLLSCESFDYPQFKSVDYFKLIAQVLNLTHQARLEATDRSSVLQLEYENLFNKENLQYYRNTIAKYRQAHRGTTHLSIVDAQDNLVAMTVSNGEGCGEILANTGIMLNNMLGEEDLNPLGINQWQLNKRLSSMMCPSIIVDKQQQIALGSGGSNRIRSAIFQVVNNIITYKMPLSEAIIANRLHFDEQYYLETDNLPEQTVTALRNQLNPLNEFNQHNFFFGGVNAVSHGSDSYEAYADTRRGGVSLVLT